MKSHFSKDSMRHVLVANKERPISVLGDWSQTSYGENGNLKRK